VFYVIDDIRLPKRFMEDFQKIHVWPFRLRQNSFGYLGEVIAPAFSLFERTRTQLSVATPVAKS
jgi:hypothetical protein